WTWFGLPPSELDRAAFERRAQPEPADATAKRVDLRARLDLVNSWLVNRRSIFTAPVPAAEGAAPAELVAGSAAAGGTRVAPPVRQEKDKLVIYGPSPVEVPERPKPPHKWMLVGAALTAAATVATAWLAPATDLVPADTALGIVLTTPAP
ncbi:MAG TPA: hypothetical protein VGL02_03675, partial [Streptomyces sp.]